MTTLAELKRLAEGARRIHERLVFPKDIRDFHDAANPATVLKLIAVVEAGKRVMMTTAHRDISPYYEVFEETAPAFRELEVALAALDQPSQEGG